MKLEGKVCWGLCLAVALSGAYLAQGQQSGGRTPGEKGQQRDATLRFPAELMPAHVYHVCPRVGGAVLEMLVEEGAQVKAGQVLARLDRKNYELEYMYSLAMVERARARLTEEEAKAKGREEAVNLAEAEVRQATAMQTLAHQKAERMRGLYKTKAVNERLVAEADSQEKVAEAHVQQLVAKHQMLQRELPKDPLAVTKAELACAEVQCTVAKLHLDNTDVCAPASGTVLAKQVEVNAIVGPGPGTGRPLSLYEIADLTEMEARVELPERDLGRVHPGQMCLIRLDTQPQVVYTGKVSRIRPLLSKQTRTATVRIAVKVTKDQPRLRPGAYGQVEFLPKE